MKFCVSECELMRMHLNKPNELEISRYLDSLHFHVPRTYLHFLDPFANVMLQLRRFWQSHMCITLQLKSSNDGVRIVVLQWGSSGDGVSVVVLQSKTFSDGIYVIAL
jgi:hypothetical protein